MSHDKNGTLLQAGDIVTVEFKVRAIHAAADPNFCNADLESVLPMPGNGFPLNVACISTKQTLLVQKGKE